MGLFSDLDQTPFDAIRPDFQHRFQFENKVQHRRLLKKEMRNAALIRFCFVEFCSLKQLTAWPSEMQNFWKRLT
jgi:hypothetical protein